MKRLVLLMLVGCGFTPPELLDSGGEPVQDAGHDAGAPVQDAGVDAGSPEPGAGPADAGTGEPRDAGGELDAGGEPLPTDAGADAGAEPDAGSVADAGGTSDAGSTDAGPGPDAGVDAGAPCTPGQPGCPCVYQGGVYSCDPGTVVGEPYVCNPQTLTCINCGYPGGPCCGGANGSCEGSGQCLHHAGSVWQCHVGYACNPSYPATFYYTKPCWEGGCCGGATCFSGGLCGP